MSQKHQEPPDKEEELPNECPSCKTVEEKIVLHISRDCIQARLNTLVGWGLQMFMKVLGLVSYMEKMISDPSEPTFVIRVCQICTIPKL